jgi:DNA-binding cell septation regulator SpoVG
MMQRPPNPAETARDNGYPSRTALATDIRRWQSFRNEARTMLGFVSAKMPSGMVVNDMKLMVGPNGRYWIALPAIKQTNADGSARLDANGKPLWSPVIEFASREARDRFQDLVLAALQRQHPHAFDRDAS